MYEVMYETLVSIIDDIEEKLPRKIASVENTNLENVLNDFDEVISCLRSMVYMLRDEVTKLEARL